VTEDKPGFWCVLQACALLLLAALAAAAQPTGAPRGANPDLNGIWQALNEANYDIEAHEARAALALRLGPYGPVPAPQVLALGAVGAVPPGLGVVEGGELPYKPEALAQRNKNRENWLTLDPEIKCYLPGVPRATYMPFPFQILQSGSAITFVYEYAGAVRNIYLKDPGKAPADSWMGQSAGHWEGNTLVVDVTALNDQSWFDRAGNFHSDQLHFVRGDHRRSGRLHSRVEDEHAALPAAGKERAAARFQVRGVRGRTDVRAIPETPAQQVTEEVVACGIIGGS